ncbi:hypothetical protein [Pseudonocardia yunnanensis]|uniref:Uncharacterized protein n=1 Tax=Pseudonocardia yunnanensis TaxID=58107 RepID=A0ABW4F8D9_9PSEU
MISRTSAGSKPEKARRILGWRPRPAADAVVDCARSLLEHEIV